MQRSDWISAPSSLPPERRSGEAASAGGERRRQEGWPWPARNMTSQGRRVDAARDWGDGAAVVTRVFITVTPTVSYATAWDQDRIRAR